MTKRSDSKEKHDGLVVVDIFPNLEQHLYRRFSLVQLHRMTEWHDIISVSYCLNKLFPIGQIQIMTRLALPIYHIWKDEMSICHCQDHNLGVVSNNRSQKSRTRCAFSELLVTLLDVDIKVALVKWFQKHSFDTEYTIRVKTKLPTDDQHVKDGVCR